MLSDRYDVDVIIWNCVLWVEEIPNSSTGYHISVSYAGTRFHGEVKGDHHKGILFTLRGYL